MTQPRSASTHSKINCMIRLSNWSMSCVWLTARAVRYMICRLLRAWASHALCGGASGTSKIALPSSCVIERTIRELSGRVAAQHDVDLVGQVFRRRIARIGEQHQRAADLQPVAAGQLVLFDALAVDEGAVRAAQVDDRVDVALAADFGMAARDFGVVNLDEVRRVAAETHHPVFQLELRPLVATRDDK